jgi:hypothetical protein
MVQAGQCADSSLSAVLVHNGEKILLAQDFDPAASGCRLDLARLQNAGERVAAALEGGADLLIVNRFGKRERDGKGLLQVMLRALDADTPVVIAVSRNHFTDWIKFAGGMCVKLTCDRGALDHWWRKVSLRASRRPILIVKRSAKLSNRPWCPDRDHDPADLTSRGQYFISGALSTALQAAGSAAIVIGGFGFGGAAGGFGCSTASLNQ